MYYINTRAEVKASLFLMNILPRVYLYILKLTVKGKYTSYSITNAQKMPTEKKNKLAANVKVKILLEYVIVQDI